MGRKKLSGGVNDLVLYSIWSTIKTRCYNKKAWNYKYYGARGIKMCEEWENSFRAFFIWSLMNGWRKGLSIDRYPDLNGMYSPNNCRWVTMLEQANNRRPRTTLTFNGKTQSIKEWAIELNMTRHKVKKLMNHESK